MGYVETLMGKNEKIIIRTRRHWMVMVGSIIGNALFAFIIIVIGVGLIASRAVGAVALPLALLAFVLLLLPAALFIRDYLAWWNEEYLITTRRVVQAEGIINKHVIDSSLEKVNDVVLSQSFLGRIFDYGDIEILTASEMGVNKLHQIDRPIKFKTDMLNQKEALGDDEHFGSHGSVEGDIPSIIAELDELRKQGVLTEEEFHHKKAALLARM